MTSPLTEALPMDEAAERVGAVDAADDATNLSDLRLSADASIRTIEETNVSDYISAINDHQARQDAAMSSPDDAVDSRFAIGLSILRDAGYTGMEVRHTGGGVFCLVLPLRVEGSNVLREVYIGPDADGHDTFSMDLTANGTWLGGWNVERTADGLVGDRYGQWLIRTMTIVSTLHLSVRTATGVDFSATRY